MKRMPEVEHTKTHTFMKEALAADSQAYVRLMFFARRAEEEGEAQAASALRLIAEGVFNHASRHLEFLAEVGDPITDMPIDSLSTRVASAIDSTNYDCAGLYEQFISIARAEDLPEIAAWWEDALKEKAQYVAKLQDILAGSKAH